MSSTWLRGLASAASRTLRVDWVTRRAIDALSANAERFGTLLGATSVCAGLNRFVVTAERSSSQLDVLVTDASKPALFKDGISSLSLQMRSLASLKSSRAQHRRSLPTLPKLAAEMLLIRAHPNTRAFAGFFAFDDAGGPPQTYLRPLAQAAEGWESRVVFMPFNSFTLGGIGHLEFSFW